MRELKFRVWNKKSTGHWIEFRGGFAISLDGDLVCPTYDKSLSKVSDEFIVVQYSGRKDKNEKEIYAGDIIEGTLDNPSFPTRGLIVYDSYWSAYGNKNKAGFTLLHKIRNPKIIGNIYENPELL